MRVQKAVEGYVQQLLCYLSSQIVGRATVSLTQAVLLGTKGAKGLGDMIGSSTDVEWSQTMNKLVEQCTPEEWKVKNIKVDIVHSIGIKNAIEELGEWRWIEEPNMQKEFKQKDERVRNKKMKHASMKGQAQVQLRPS